MIIKGEKIQLQRLKPAHAEQVQAILNHEEITQYLVFPFPYTLKKAQKYIRKSHLRWQNQTAKVFGIFTNEQMIGVISLHNLNSATKAGEIFYVLDTQFQKKGLGFEAAKILINFAFEELKIQTIKAKVIPENIASIHLLKKLGFEFDSKLPHAVERQGKIYFHDLYLLKNHS